MSLDFILFFELLTYFLIFIALFTISNNQKNKFRRISKRFISFLQFNLILIFISSLFIFYFAFLLQKSFGIILILNLFFIIYIKIFKDSRNLKWIQHRMWFYNFFFIICIYFSSLVLGFYINFFVFLIYIYTFFEYILNPSNDLI